MSESILNEIGSNFNDKKYRDVSGISDLITATMPNATKKEKMAVYREAQITQNESRKKFNAKLKSKADLIGGSEFEDVGPNTKAYFAKTISNPIFYDSAGNWTGDAFKALADDKAKTIQKLYTRLDNAEKIGRQKSKYEARGDRPMGETIGRTIVPDAYTEGKTGLEKWFAGGVNVLEAGGRTAMATKRALSGEAPFMASMQAEAGDKTTEESIVGGVVGTPGLFSGAKAVGKLAGGAAKIASGGKTTQAAKFLANKAKETKLGKVYKEGADLIDDAENISRAKEIGVAGVAPQKGEFGKKLFTSFVRNAPREATTSGIYVGEAATNKDKGALEIVSEVAGSSVGMALGAVVDALRNSSLKSHRASVADGMSEDAIPAHFTGDYFERIKDGIKSGEYPTSADAIIKKFEVDAMENLQGVDESSRKIIESILKTAADNPNTRTPSEFIKKAKENLSKERFKEGNDPLVNSKIEAEVDEFLNSVGRSIVAKVKRDGDTKSGVKLSKARGDLDKKREGYKGQLAEELETTEISNEVEPTGFGNFYEAESQNYGLPKGSPDKRIAKNVEEDVQGLPVGSNRNNIDPNEVEGEMRESSEVDSFDKYLKTEGTDVDRRMRVREKEMGMYSDKPTLGATREARIDLDQEVYNTDKKVMTAKGDVPEETKQTRPDIKARRAIEGVFEADLDKLFPEGGEVYKRLKKLYSIKKSSKIGEIFDNATGKVNTKNANAFVNKIISETSSMKKVSDFTTTLKLYKKEASELNEFLLSQSTKEPKLAEIANELKSLVSKQEKALKALGTAKNEIEAMAFVDKIVKSDAHARLMRSGLISSIDRWWSRNKNKVGVKPITGAIKRILVNAPRSSKEVVEDSSLKSDYFDDKDSPVAEKHSMTKSGERSFIKENPMVSNSTWVRVAKELGERGVSHSYKIPTAKLDAKEKKRLVRLLNNKNKGIFKISESGNNITLKRIK
tara:strand:+ start:6256 stop:9144 length:2889 start_codon:yes stop_codon:yes gene_type:complete